MRTLSLIRWIDTDKLFTSAKEVTVFSIEALIAPVLTSKPRNVDVVIFAFALLPTQSSTPSNANFIEKNQVDKKVRK